MSFWPFVILYLTAASAVVGAPSTNTIRRVEVTGNVRFPTPGILRLVSSAPGKVFDEARAREDLRRLHETGFFREISVKADKLPDGRTDLKFELTEQPYISGLTINGVDPALERQIRDTLRKEKLEPRPATAFNPAAAARAGALVRNLLRAAKYPQPDVSVTATPEGSRSLAQVELDIQMGPRLPIAEVEFDGNAHATSGELMEQIQHSRPARLWDFWSGNGGYVREALDSDLERIRVFYRSRGFASAQVGPAEINAQMDQARFPFSGEKPRLHIRIPVHEGPVFTLAAVSLEGNPKSAAGDVQQLLLGTLTVPTRYDRSKLDSVRSRMVDALGRAGYPMANVRLEQSLDDAARSVRATYSIDAGEPAIVGRIRFEGNVHVPDRFLRRELLTAEGQVFDSAKLDRSIVRLNRSNLIKDVARADVSLQMDPERQELDVLFKVKENDLRGIYGTGGIADGGYLGLVYSAFNLLGIGEKISLELDGGAAQSNVLLNMVGQHFLGSPFTIGLSAFHRLTNVNVANIVPDAQDIVHAFRGRSNGIALSGSYPISEKVQVGLAYQFGGEGTTAADTGSAAYSRGEITPTLILDSTDNGRSRRGYRAEFARTWAGPASLGSIEAGREAFRITRFAPDPLTRGKNSFVFRLQGAFAHSGGNTLAPDLRFYPGTEVARGFARGGLSAWGLTSAGTSASDLSVLGADAVLGFSAEYHFPISGPLSGAGFFDLGWSALRPSSVQPGDISLLEKTSSLLRASTGAELRLQLPMIRQPARLIFAWNPLRLDALVGRVSPFRLADPRTAIRFALGD